MKKVGEILGNILASILVGILALAGTICLIPFVIIYMVIALPAIAIDSIWHSYPVEDLE